jgi:hypothetical protein
MSSFDDEFLQHKLFPYEIKDKNTATEPLS